MDNSIYQNLSAKIGSQIIGKPITRTFNSFKHLERSHFISQNGGVGRTWLGLLKLNVAHEEISPSFLKETEMSGNIIEVDGPGHIIQYAIGFEKGATFILENLCDGSSLVGRGNTPWHMLVSDNSFANGDFITHSLHNGKGLRVQTIEEKGDAARIIPMNGGFRILVALDSLNDEDGYSQEFLVPGTKYYKVGNNNGGEYANYTSSLTGMAGGMGSSKRGVQLYGHTVGTSEQAISITLTGEATHSSYKVEDCSHPQLMNMAEAAKEVSEYLMMDDKGNAIGAMWENNLIKNMQAELAMMKNRMAAYGTGHSFYNSHGQKQIIGQGVYPTLKERGNYSTYTDFRQLYSIIMQLPNMLGHMQRNVKVADRYYKIKGGTVAITELSKSFSNYFASENKFPLLADHPALIKSNMIDFVPGRGLVYKPIQFMAVFLPGIGNIILEEDESLNYVSDGASRERMIGGYNESSGTIFIEDVTSPDFTNALPASMRNPKQRNISMIKRKGYKESIEFLVGSGCNDEMLKSVGVTTGAKVISTREKGLEIIMRTEGEMFVHDASKMYLLEYKPRG